MRVLELALRLRLANATHEQGADEGPPGTHHATQSFFVLDSEGPLKEGELDRACPATRR
jgi:hypothetical protein